MHLSTRYHRPATNRGTTLLDVIVGIGLLLIVFLSIFGAFQLAVELVLSTKAKTGALALAGEQMEFVRSLPYDNVGTVGGIPSGNIAQQEEIVLNNTTYTRRTFIQFIDDPADGEGAADETGITADYKKVKIEMSWNIKEDTRSLSLVSNIVPKGIESIAGGGTLTINVIDALGAPVPSAQARIVNDTTSPTIDVTTFTNASGVATFPGSPTSADYEVTVTKTGFSTAQTYDADASNPNPNPGHLTVTVGNTTASTFAIDTLATKVVRTFEPVQPGMFEDTFDAGGFISTSTNITVSGGEVRLSGGVTYGALRSNTVAPSFITEWNNFTFIDTVPASTTLIYQVYYDTGSSQELVPDAALPGNSAGFTTAVDLSSLSTTTYSSLQMAATLTADEVGPTPTIDSWELSYQEGPLPLPNIPFSMRGNKTIGTDADDDPIYKYENTSLSTDAGGTVDLGSLEWDSYIITIDNVGIGYDISESCNPQPRGINPGEAVTTDLTLVSHTTNSFLVAVQDESGNMIPGASARLHRTGYDQTQTTSSCGQTFFGGVSSNTYSLDVSASGFVSQFITDVDVSGPSGLTVTLVAS